MTGIPVAPVNLGNGQVVQGGGAPDPVAMFLQAFLQGSGQGAQSYQATADRAARSSANSAQLDLEKQKLAFQIQQEKTRQEAEKNKGVAIQAMIAKMGMAQDAQAQSHERQMTPMPVTGQPLVQPGVGPLPPIQQTPGAGTQAPAGPASGQSDPFQMLAGVMNGVNPSSAADVLKDIHPLFQDALKRDASAKADVLQERALAAIPADKREAARSVIQFAKIGANLPAAMQQQLWPDLFPPGQTIDPQQLNAASTLYKTGAFTWKQAAREAGITTNTDAPKYVPPINPLAKALMGGARAMVASNLVTEMTFAGAAIDAWEDKHPEGLSFIGQVKKDNVGAGVIAGIKRSIANGLVKGDESTAITAAVDFASGWAHLTSGVRISDDQFNRILHNTTRERNDPPETVAYKRNMRAVMIQGGQDISKGVRTPTQVIDAALHLPWTKDQKQMLQIMKGDAIKYERQLKTGTAPVGVSSTAPGDPQAMQDQLDQLRALVSTQVLSSPEP